MSKEINTAVVLAAGVGKRMGGDVAKQYMLLGGKPVLWYALNCFQSAERIDEVILVVGKGEIPYATREFVEKYGFTKVTKVIEGGAERYLSVWEALKTMERKTEGFVFIHDGARPFVTHKIIEDTYRAAKAHGGSVAAMPVKDTIKIADEEGFAKDTPNRKTVWMVQTPQVFERERIVTAYESMIESLPVLTVKGVQITDDAMVMETMTGEKVKLVQASYENIKITTPEDMKIAECLL